MNKMALAILVVVSASIALAEDFRTIKGKEYKNVTVSRVEPDGIVVTGESGISKLYFTELPKEVQERFHYDPKAAEEYSEDQAKAVEEARKQREDELRRYEEERKRQNEEFAKELGRVELRKKIPVLQARLAELADEENDLNQRIWEANQLLQGVTIPGRHGPSHTYFQNPNKADVPFLEKQLKDVWDEEGKLSKQLKEAQRSTGK